MTDVWNIKPEDNQLANDKAYLISTLQTLLDGAKNGEINSIAYVVELTNEESCYIAATPLTNTSMVLGNLFSLMTKIEISAQANDVYKDDDEE